MTHESHLSRDLTVSNRGLVDQDVALSLERSALLSINFLHDFDVENEKKVNSP